MFVSESNESYENNAIRPVKQLSLPGNLLLPGLQLSSRFHCNRGKVQQQNS